MTRAFRYGGYLASTVLIVFGFGAIVVLIVGALGSGTAQSLVAPRAVARPRCCDRHGLLLPGVHALGPTGHLSIELVRVGKRTVRAVDLVHPLGWLHHGVQLGPVGQGR
jgi:hypothetical protein